MASPLARLKRRSEFLRVAKTRRKWVANGLIVQARRYGHNGRAAAGGAPFRVGYTVSKKVGNAVERNRVRRRLRVVAQAVIGAHGAPGYDFVVIGRKNALKRPFAALLKDMETALKKLEAWREGPIRGLQRRQDHGDEMTTRPHGRVAHRNAVHGNDEKGRHE